MGIFRNFPYTNFHDLNLDWLLSKMKDLSAEWDAFLVNWGVELKNEVNKWLIAHPEYTTTVMDGSLTKEKFTEELKRETLKEYVTPQMFGAVGDGETDDTIAFQTMLASGKDIIFIPEGTYYIRDTLIFPSGKDVTCAGLLEFHGVVNAVILGTETINKFNIRSLRITANVYNEASIGIQIQDCIESNFSNLFANGFGTNIFVTAVDGVSAYNTFINPVATRGKYNFKVYGNTSPKHCNENYIFGGRFFADSNTLVQLSLDHWASSWTVVGVSAEGSGECAVYCNTAYCSFIQIRTEGTWSIASFVFGTNSDRNRVFATRYDSDIQDNGVYNTYITNRMGTKLITSTSQIPSLTLTAPGGGSYKAMSVLINGIERFAIKGDNTTEVHALNITQYDYAYEPLKFGPYTFWMKNGYLRKKEGTPSSATDGNIVGKEYRAFDHSPVGTLEPHFIGDEVFDNVNKIWYKSTGTTVNDWVALNS